MRTTSEFKPSPLLSNIEWRSQLKSFFSSDLAGLLASKKTDANLSVEGISVLCLLVWRQWQNFKCFGGLAAVSGDLRCWWGFLQFCPAEKTISCVSLILGYVNLQTFLYFLVQASTGTPPGSTSQGKTRIITLLCLLQKTGPPWLLLWVRCSL